MIFSQTRIRLAEQLRSQEEADPQRESLFLGVTVIGRKAGRKETFTLPSVSSRTERIPPSFC